MIIHFYLKFSTHIGQSIFVSGTHTQLGNDNKSKAFALQYLNNEFWHGYIEINNIAETAVIQYKYILKEEGKIDIIEFENDRKLKLDAAICNTIVVYDTWSFSSQIENAYFTQPFQKVLLKTAQFEVTNLLKTYTHELRVKAPILNKNEVICLIGQGNTLNNWASNNPLLLSKTKNWWTLRINFSKEDFPLAYKYGIYNTQQKKIVTFEDGENRILMGDATPQKITICHDGFANIKYTAWKGAGVAIPVFSLRSKNSFGTGEFTDINLLVDWAKKIGLKLIQLLPLNDTSATFTYKDSYPYAAISAFALHPLYLNITAVAGAADALLVPSKKIQEQLNALPNLDYESVIKYKIQSIKNIYLKQKANFLKNKKFILFFEQNTHWLQPYAAFCFLRDKYKTCNFTTWEKYSIYNKNTIQELTSATQKHFDDIAVHYFTQYHLHVQLKNATTYAHKNGIVVKGDIPIGIYRNSVDAWMQPLLYNMDAQAGAPPDDFAVKGQNWGFPTYNWQAMLQDDFMWWQLRFKQMTNYFDAFRIDHILGFFRIWSIPLNAIEGIMGKFDPAIPIDINEFYQNHITFNTPRFCQPFINDDVLYQLFGDDINYIKEKFLHQNQLKENFNTQQKVENYFASINDPKNKIKYGLFNLISNVILFEDENLPNQKFHFRIGMEQTLSYQNLDNNTKQALHNLYINYFYYQQDDFWQNEAMRKLPSLKQSTNMLICGEDLGMVPHCVPTVMKQLGILSLEIQRMPKEKNTTFFHPNDAPYMSVVTPSTHDMSTIRGWWEEDKNKTQLFYNTIMGRYGQAPFYCEVWINKEIVLQHLYSPAMWAIFQLQDIIGISASLRRENPNDERINIPANPNHYWKYRMHIYLEDLITQDDFNDVFKNYIVDSGR